MGIMNNNRVVYQITVDDFQTVSNDILERDLSEKEINIIERKIGDHIDWYGAIQESLMDIQH
jgi:hypothetical protein